MARWDAHCRSLGQALWEVRSNLSGGRVARVIFAVDEGELYLLHGFSKKSRKTPREEFDVALKRLAEGRE
jgi:phage-related protein